MTGSDITIDVKVTPSAGRDEIRLSDRGTLIIRVKEPPVRGKANRAVVKLLAQTLGLPKSSVVIVAGATARGKRVKLVDGRKAFESLFGRQASAD